MNILLLDQNILVWINGLLVGKSSLLDGIVKFFGVYLIYGLPLILIFLWFYRPTRRETLFLCLLAALLSWLLITKLIVPVIWFRPRPDLVLLGTKELLFQRPDYSFPSDHATALFAITFGLYWFNWSRAANWFLLFSIIIVICRVALGIHYPLDIIAGASSGLIGVTIVYLLRGPIIRYLYKPVVWVLHKVRLA